MPFIGRRPDGSIYGYWTQSQPQDADHPGLEEVADDHPDVTAFKARPVPGAGRKTIEERVADLENKVK